MNPRVKDMWLTALRSGEYKQGGGALYRHASNTYCCLGVLCELAVAEGITTKSAATGRSDATYSAEMESMSLPLDVQEWAGLDTFDPPVMLEIYEDDEMISAHSCLSEVNDEYKKTFPEIADLIEEQL